MMQYKFWKCKSENPKGTILFVHGYAATSFYFDDAARLLTNDFDYYAVELPGMGVNPDLTKELSPISYAKQIIEWLEEMKIDNLYLIGHSMGGGIVNMVASMAPHLFKKMISICPMNSSIHIKLLNALKVTPTLNTKVAFRVQKYIYHDYKTRYALKDKDPLIKTILEYQRMIRKNTKKLFSNMSSPKNMKLLKEAEQKVSIPSLLITADNDRLIHNKSAAKRILKNKNFSYYNFSNCGHVPFEEKTEETVKVIKDFIEK